MTSDRTQIQGDEEHRKSRRLSLERTQPPTHVPGYEPQKFLGAGAYGEVWVALDRNTGRQVAIKFYLHRGGLDWSLLNREVEKLVFLSADRYVVQLLDVGWDADPPFYVMEYLPNGSLDEHLASHGKLEVDEAISIFRDVAIGLVHAHGRGVLHCDLKPANVLLDQDFKPRLGDFGQSRLSHEQDPSLGTLFYMAPEQADMEAVPDARWDVYALGALLYAMLTGLPPYRNPEAISQMDSARDLSERLERYRGLIQESPPPSNHRTVNRVDRSLADIVDRCLAPDPARRFPNPQMVLDALDDRAARRARRPLVALGAVGPCLLLLVMGFGAWKGLDIAMKKTDTALTERVLQSNRFAARAQAAVVESELERRFRAVERMAGDPAFVEIAAQTIHSEELSTLRRSLNDPAEQPETLETAREAFRTHTEQKPLQELLEAHFEGPMEPVVASWFFNGPEGLQMARAPWNVKTIGQNYGWRTYFHGQPEDHAPDWRPSEDDQVRETHLSTVFLSQASGRWIVGISTPVYRSGPEGEFLGVLALTVEVGRFVNKLAQSEGQVAVLVDWRDGPNRGLILQHPLFEKLERVPDRFKDRVVPKATMPDGTPEKTTHYRDPMADDASGEEYAGRWLADAAPVRIRDVDSELRVIVQEKHRHAIGSTMTELGSGLIRIGVIALAGAAAVITLLWGFVSKTFVGETKFTSSTATVEPGDPGPDEVPTVSYKLE